MAVAVTGIRQPRLQANLTELLTTAARDCNAVGRALPSGAAPLDPIGLRVAVPEDHIMGLKTNSNCILGGHCIYFVYMTRVWLSLIGTTLCALVAAGQVPDTLSHTIWNPSQGPQRREYQGTAVALDGTRLAVVAPGADFQRTDEGIIRFYDIADAEPNVPSAVLRNPEQSGTFGEFIAFVGRKVVFMVSRQSFTNGRIFVFDPDLGVITRLGPGLWAEPELVARSGSRIAAQVFGEPRILVFDLDSELPDEPVFDLSHASLVGVSSVEMDGDLIAVGFEFEGPPTGARPGVVRLFNLAAGNPEVPVEEIPNPIPEIERFGRSLALQGDRLAVAAGAASEQGVVHEFSLSGTEASPSRTLHGPEGTREFGKTLVHCDHGLIIASSSGPGWFARKEGEPVAFTDLPVRSLAVSGKRLAAGVPWDSSGIGSGLTATFDLSPGIPVEVQRFSTPAPANLNDFGRVLSTEGGLLAVGAPADHEASAFSGSVTLYEIPSGAQVARLFEPGTHLRARFGSALDLSARWLAVGAPGTGRVYLYDRAMIASPPTVISDPDGADPDRGFGTSLSLSGDRLVVGAPEAGSGRALVYDLGEDGATLTRTAINPGRGSEFGVSVELSDHLLLVSTDFTSETWAYDVTGTDPLVPQATLQQPLAQLDYPKLLVEGDWAITAGTRRAIPAGGRLMIFSGASGSPRYLGFRNFLAKGGSRGISGLALDGNLLALGTEAVGFFDLGDVDTVPLPEIGQVAASGALALEGGVLAVGAWAKTGNGQTGLGAVELYIPGPRLSIHLGPTVDYPELDPRETVRFRIPQGESLQRTMTLQNTGSESLHLSFGALPAGFSLVTKPREIPAGSSETLVLRFQGHESSGGDLVIHSNDLDNTPLDVRISGNIVPVGTDTDRDGLSDAVEISLAPLGFDWRWAQPELVSVLSDFAFSGGLVNQEQLRGMKVGTVLTRNGSGAFRLLLDLRRSPDLLNFHDFPLNPADVWVTEEGDLDIRFDDDEEAAFFLFEAP